jgi:hypothetical protein
MTAIGEGESVVVDVCVWGGGYVLDLKSVPERSRALPALALMSL